MITYRKDLDLTSMVDDIAQRIQDEVDQQALDKAAATLAKFGYVKVVRCRDCEHYEDYTGCCTRRDYVAPMAVTLDGFCSCAERREE